MKKIIIVLIVFIFPAISVAQEHSTIERLEVNYKLSTHDTLSLDSVKVNAFLKVTLKNSTGLTKIHLKVKNIFSSEVLFQVENINPEVPVIGEEGLVLFQKTGEIISMNCPNKWPLSSYLYEIITENENSDESEPFIQIQ